MRAKGPAAWHGATSALIASLALCADASGQLTPTKTYFGVHRPVVLNVDRPAGADGDIEILVLEVPSGTELRRAAAAEGPVNLATLFDGFWPAPLGAADSGGAGEAGVRAGEGDSIEATSAGLLTGVRFAQLSVGGVRVGAPVVLQPMAGVRYAEVDRTGTPQFKVEEDGDKAFTGIRAWVDQRVVFETSAGEIEVAFRPDAAPNTVWNFLELARGGFYDGTMFHRIVPFRANGTRFVIQGGDPSGTGDGGPGYYIDLEPTTLEHDYGVISMARGSNPNSSGAQFFFCLSRDGTRHLDGRYTAFGRAVRGAEAIERIASSPISVEKRDRPVEPPVVQRVRLIGAPAYSGPPAWVTDPTATPASGR